RKTRVYFFFQAEDGIRDFHVTGVQTCALPIFVTFVNWGGYNEPLFREASGAQEAGYAGRLIPGAMVYALAEGLIMQTNVLHGTRSEERRVGKEGRPRRTT